MGKAKLNKQLKRQQREILKKYDNVKLSQALIVLCEPYKMPRLTQRQYKSLISLSAAAWNIAIAPEETRQQKLLETVQLLPEFKHITEKEDLIALADISSQEEPSNAAVILQILQGMMQKKFELFPNDDRIVVDFWFESKLDDDVLQAKKFVHEKHKKHEKGDAGSVRLRPETALV